ncbi:hypothetical protein BJ170DRAFT_68509 [Xylariales sp. AK1849]|nr:hypothetical protein BJ170DRAFT_68509 [Xylariales sp. AK1849]
MNYPVPIMVQPVAHIPVRKRARPAFFHPAWPSGSDERLFKRGKDSGKPMGSSRTSQIGMAAYRNPLHCGSSVVTTAVAGAAAISATASSAAALPDETGTGIGCQTRCVPTIELGQRNPLGVESGMVAPTAAGSSPRGHASASLPLPPDPAQFPLGFTHQDHRTWTSSSSENYNPMFHHPVYPPYDRIIPPQDLYQDHYPCATNLSHDVFPNMNSDDAMTSPPTDHNFALLDASFHLYNAHYHPDSLLDFHATNMNQQTDEFGWTMVHPQHPVDVAGEISPNAASSASHSSSERSETSRSSIDKNWALVPHYTDDIVEVCDGHNASVSASCKSPNPTRKLSISKNKGGRRQPLGLKEREQARITRRMVACVRCQMQRVRCDPNPDRPNDADCMCYTCAKVILNSKKVIHRLPCARYKLTSATLFREGGLKLTARWKGAAMEDLGPEDWVADKTRTIQISLGLCENPIELRVRKFKPQLGDVLPRYWKDKYGKQQETPVEPYALEDIQRASVTFQQHINENAKDAVWRYANKKNVHHLVRKTYMAAWNHMVEVDYVSAGVDAKMFMEDLFRLWFAMRNSMGSAWIAGKDTLDMKPDRREDYPFPGRITVPRMVCQQFDSFNFSQSMSPWRRKVLTNLMTLMRHKDSKCFYTVFLAVFMLLHEASAISQDRYIHARDKPDIQGRYDMPFVEDLQEGTNIVLMFWHYYRRGLDPVAADWAKIREERGKKKSKNLYRDIEPDETRIMSELCEATNRGKFVPETDYERAGLKDEGDVKGYVKDYAEMYPLLWERDLYFVSQMFMDDWRPADTWRR